MSSKPTSKKTKPAPVLGCKSPGRCQTNGDIAAEWIGKTWKMIVAMGDEAMQWGETYSGTITGLTIAHHPEGDEKHYKPATDVVNMEISYDEEQLSRAPFPLLLVELPFTDLYAKVFDKEAVRNSIWAVLRDSYRFYLEDVEFEWEGQPF